VTDREEILIEMIEDATKNNLYELTRDLMPKKEEK
jgi:hypothetical protein